jgi:putative redox protein
MAVLSEKITFPGSTGEMLAARFDRPVGSPRAVALFAHCFTCSKDTLAAGNIARALADAGVATLRFDFTGLGQSEGEFANTNFSSNVADLLAAAEHLRKHYLAPALLIGHSLGGAAVLAAADRMEEVKLVATIGAPADPAHVRRLFAEKAPEIEARGEAEVVLAGRRFRIRKSFLDDIETHASEAAIARLRKALIIFHSPIDAIVDVDNARRIYQAARHPKSFVALDGADHLLSRREDGEYVGSVLANWVLRYLGAIPDEWPQPAAGEVVVEEAGAGPYLNRVAAGRHRLYADEPGSVGGQDAGPAPYDLLAAALGTCTAMTVRMYANQKRWPLEKIRVSVRHAKIHAVDCAECETKEGKIDRFDRVIRFTGALDATQRSRLLEIADKCPVHRTLRSEVDISTTVDDKS